MKRRCGVRILWVPLIFVLCGGCSAKSSAYESAVQYSSAADAGRELKTAEFDSAAGSGGESTLNPAVTEKTRKLVRTAGLRLRVQDPGGVETPLMAALGKYGAYVSSSRIYENSRYYVIRLPEASWEVLLKELEALGRVLHRTESAEDVTLRYYDLEGRLATKEALLKTYRAYLQKAETIEDIMTVEARIAELQNEIDWTGTELRSLADLVDYATINLDIEGPPSASPDTGPGLGERLETLFSGVGDFASTALVILAGFIIYGIPALLLAFLLFWLLFGRVGLLKKLWRLAAGKKQEDP